MRASNFDVSPFLVIWEVTRSCDLACVHCRAEAMPDPNPLELNHREGKQLIDQVVDSGCRRLVLTGGDPLKRKDILELIAYGTRRGLQVSVSPSATPLLTAQSVQGLKDAGVARIALSLDGSSAAVHDHFRGIPGTFDRTVEAIESIRSLEVPLQINTTVSRYNRHDLAAIVDRLEAWDVVLWSLFFLVPAGRGKVDDVLDADEHEAVYQWLYRVSQTANFDVKTTEGQPYRRVMIQHRRDQDRAEVPTRPGQDGFGRMRQGINGGKGFCFVTHTGNVCPSGFLELAGGNVRYRPLADVYRNSPLFRQLRDADLLRGKCGRCEYRKICGGSRARAYALTGDYLASDPTCVYQPRASTHPLEIGSSRS